MTPTELVTGARACRSNAHVPYSRFRAGAAVHTDSGIYATSVADDAPISRSTVGELLPNGPFVRR